MSALIETEGSASLLVAARLDLLLCDEIWKVVGSGDCVVLSSKDLGVLTAQGQGWGTEPGLSPLVRFRTATQHSLTKPQGSMGILVQSGGHAERSRSSIGLAWPKPLRLAPP